MKMLSPAIYASLPETIPSPRALRDEVVSEHGPRQTLAVSSSPKRMPLNCLAGSVVLPHCRRSP